LLPGVLPWTQPHSYPGPWNFVSGLAIRPWSRDRRRHQISLRAIVEFRLRLTKSAQHFQATATLRDSAIMISPGYRASHASACLEPCRDRRWQTAVCRRRDRHSAGAMIHDEVRRPYTQDARRTFMKWSADFPGLHVPWCSGEFLPGSVSRRFQDFTQARRCSHGAASPCRWRLPWAPRHSEAATTCDSW